MQGLRENAGINERIGGFMLNMKELAKFKKIYCQHAKEDMLFDCDEECKNNQCHVYDLIKRMILSGLIDNNSLYEFIYNL